MLNAMEAVFDYKSSQPQQVNATNSEPKVCQEEQNTTNNNDSYSSITKSVPKQTFPKKEQAIILHVDPNLKLFDYVRSIGNIVGPKNIIFASRISNNRICIYLKSEETVDQLIQCHQIITIEGIQHNIRRLISPTKRIVISNISPFISHDIVENIVKNLGFQLASPVTFLRAGIPGDEYNHILSFRRQVYIQAPTEDFELQTSVLIQFEGTDYRIFLSTDKMECFLCKHVGHIASTCPNPPIISENKEEDRPQTIPQADAFDHTLNNPTQKRQHSDTLSSIDPQQLPIEEVAAMPPPTQTSLTNTKTRPNKKKRKKDTTSQTPITENSKTIIKEKYSENPNNFILPIDNFIAFLENTFGGSDPYTEALRFTSDIKTLLENIYTLYPFLQERAIKNRFTRLHKKIKAHLISEGLEIESIADSSDREEPLSDCSQQSNATSY